MAEKTNHNNISLDKAFQIIEYLSLSNIPLSVSEISQKLNFNRATTNNLLGTMLSHKYVTKDRYGKYSISSKFFEIGCAYHNNNPLVQAFVQQNFFETHNYNCAFGLSIPVYPQKGILLCVQNHMDNFDDIPLVGNSLPLYASGAGKLILAYSSEEYRDLFFATQDNCEVRPNLCCLSAPVFNAEQTLAAAVSITGSKDFILSNESKLIKDITSCAQLITYRIGGQAP